MKKRTAVSSKPSAAKKPAVEKPVKKTKVARSAKTGEFVSKTEAKRKPAETVVETVVRKKRARKPKDSLHMPEIVEAPEMTPQDAAEAARHESAIAEAPALAAEAQAAHSEQESLNEAAGEHGFEPERHSSHATAVAANR